MPDTLNKAHIVEAAAEANGFTIKQAGETVETLIEIIKRSLESGEDVLISGFGKFCVKAKNERKGLNPATGESMVLNSRKVVTFKCAGKLRELVNK